MNSCTVYWAGALFDHKDLLGNVLLARAVERESGGRYQVLLPQDLEQTDFRATAIRDQDLARVMSCDCAVFGFDGPELDSGTVVEFMFAKLLDIPAVVLRTDFRSGGDQDGEPWNLMCSGYPRTVVRRVNAMAGYQGARGGSLQEGLDLWLGELGTEVVKGLDAACAEPALMSPDEREVLYRWACTFPGGGLKDLLSDKLADLVARR